MPATPLSAPQASILTAAGDMSKIIPLTDGKTGMPQLHADHQDHQLGHLELLKNFFMKKQSQKPAIITRQRSEQSC
jgi:hypothetical protein